jgi:hypothetical protein
LMCHNKWEKNVIVIINFRSTDIPPRLSAIKSVT